MRSRRRGEIGLLSLVAIVFFNVSGGPYGLEDAIGTLGPGLALVLLLVTPLVWSLPVGLAMAELAAALPEEGGYVVWVRRAFGRFWSFQVGWWSWINSFVDVAVYPALFADYVGFWRPHMSPLERWALVLAFIWTLTAINLAGVRITGRVAVAMAGLSLLPVVVLTALAGTQLREVPWRPFAAEEGSLLTGLGLGLAIMMWNYSGWDAPTTTLGETRDPGPSFRRAVWVALPLITLAYVLPVAASLSAVDGWEDWDTGHWPVVAAAIGGPWLATWSRSARCSPPWGSSCRCSSPTRACPTCWPWPARCRPRWGGSTRASPRRGARWSLSSVAYSVCAFWSFKELIVLNIWLYSITLVLELAAFVALRLREPELPRPWRVGGGRAGMWLVALLPSLLLPARDGDRGVDEYRDRGRRGADRPARLPALAGAGHARGGVTPGKTARQAAGLAAGAIGRRGRTRRPWARRSRQTPARNAALPSSPPAQLSVIGGRSRSARAVPAARAASARCASRTTRRAVRSPRRARRRTPGARAATRAIASGAVAIRRARAGDSASRSQARPIENAEPSSPSSGPRPPARASRPRRSRPSAIEPVPARSSTPGTAPSAAR